ncbi:MAG: hypothetical protein ACREOJ_06675 [Gemmatimonadaceae bacterium]
MHTRTTFRHDHCLEPSQSGRRLRRFVPRIRSRVNSSVSLTMKVDPLFEYAHHWLRATAVRLYRPFDILLTRLRVREIDEGRPGFAAQLRLVALQALHDDNPSVVHRGIAALAVVGEVGDVEALKAVPPEQARAARTAIFEIEHTANASQRGDAADGGE